jgi:hypothetical protein
MAKEGIAGGRELVPGFGRQVGHAPRNPCDDFKIAVGHRFPR